MSSTLTWPGRFIKSAIKSLSCKSVSCSDSKREEVEYPYMAGFKTPLQSEALAGAVPPLHRHPHKCKYGLYTEQINGTGFCAPRVNNLATWLYRINPTVVTTSEYTPYEHPTLVSEWCCPGDSPTPQLMRWNPMPFEQLADRRVDFVDGLVTLAGTGNPSSTKGMAVHWYCCNADMQERSFSNNDGDMCIVVQDGALDVQTEFGRLRIAPGQVLIMPRGLKMSVKLPDGRSRGWIGEVFEGHLGFQLPNLGPIGSHGLADARDFEVPVAEYEDRKCDHEVIVKAMGGVFSSRQTRSPYDVVGWSGSYHPAKYDLSKFKAFGSTSWDHGDPSLHTVLTVPTDAASGLSACDFVCFKGRWDVARDTFKPPYYHRNAAAEFNAVIKLAKPYLNIHAGTCFVTPTMTPHGISAGSVNGFHGLDAEKANEPLYLGDDSMWIMFESCYPLLYTKFAVDASWRDHQYLSHLQGAKRMFTGPPSGRAAS